MVKLVVTLILGVNLSVVEIEIDSYDELEECVDYGLVYEIQYAQEALDFIWECREI